MQIFITGATGFLGHELLEALRARRHGMTALVRSRERAAALPPGVRSILGAVEEPDSYRGPLRGHDALVHVAALVKMWSRHRGDFDRVNVEGTETLLRSAAEAGVPKLVYSSSFIALGPSNGAPLAEDDGRRTETTHNDYERSKTLADRAARRLIEEGLPLYILYPGVIYGPGNLTDGNLVARNVIPFLNGRMPFGMDLKAWSYAFVQDVVQGFINVIEGTPPSRRYILGGDNRTGAEFYQALHRVTGQPPPRWNIPLGAASLAGYGEYLLAELFGRQPTLLTHEVARIYRRSWTYDSARARREIGYSITPLDQGLARLVAWLKSAGHVR